MKKLSYEEALAILEKKKPTAKKPEPSDKAKVLYAFLLFLVAVLATAGVSALVYYSVAAFK